MDRKIRNLQRLSSSDPIARERYIRELERLAGIAAESEEQTLKCLVDNCLNHANEGHGLYLMTQHNTLGQPIYNWDNALGPLFICGPCYNHLKKAPWRGNNGQYLSQISGSTSPFIH